MILSHFQHWCGLFLLRGTSFSCYLDWFWCNYTFYWEMSLLFCHVSCCGWKIRKPACTVFNHLCCLDVCTCLSISGKHNTIHTLWHFYLKFFTLFLFFDCKSWGVFNRGKVPCNSHRAGVLTVLLVFTQHLVARPTSHSSGLATQAVLPHMLANKYDCAAENVDIFSNTTNILILAV